MTQLKNYYNNIIFIAIIFSCLGKPLLHANSVGKSLGIQPTIIVIPFAKEGEDLRTVLEADISRRVAIAKVKEGFDNRGFTTVDFVATLKAMSVDEVYTSGDLSDLKSTLIEASRADIYVEVEAYKVEGSGGASSARIIMTAFDAFTARSLATKTSSSVESRADFTKLVENALKRKTGDGVQIELIEEFLNTMQEKFDDIVENGRAIKIQFTLDPNVIYNFDSECASGELLRDELEFWMEENAFKSNSGEARVANLRMIFDEVRIPVRLENGKNYRPFRFAREIRLFLQKLNVIDAGGSGLTADIDVRGGTIYVSLK